MCSIRLLRPTVMGLCAAGIAVGACPPAHSRVLYTVQNLGQTDDAFSFAKGINKLGQVVGGAYTQWGVSRVFVWRNGVRTYLQTPPEYSGVSIGRISDSGRITGEVDGFAALWSNSQPVDLGFQGTANDVNASGHVVGVESNIDSKTTQEQAFLWSEETGKIPLFSFGSFSAATGINCADQIVGYSTVSDGSTHAMLWENLPHDLGTLGGANSRAQDINRQGMVVGSSDTDSHVTHAFLWNRITGMHDLGTLAGCTDSYALGVNGGGFIVGNAKAGDLASVKAVFWDDNGITDLNSVIAPDSGWVLRYAYDVNDTGEIVGWGHYQGRPCAFALIPLASLPGCALKAAGGLDVFTGSEADVLDVEQNTGAKSIDICDAVRLARRASGVDAAP